MIVTSLMGRAVKTRRDQIGRIVGMFLRPADVVRKHGDVDYTEQKQPDLVLVIEVPLIERGGNELITCHLKQVTVMPDHDFVCLMNAQARKE